MYTVAVSRLGGAVVGRAGTVPLRHCGAAGGPLLAAAVLPAMARLWLARGPSASSDAAAWELYTCAPGDDAGNGRVIFTGDLPYPIDGYIGATAPIKPPYLTFVVAHSLAGSILLTHHPFSCVSFAHILFSFLFPLFLILSWSVFLVSSPSFIFFPRIGVAVVRTPPQHRAAMLSLPLPPFPLQLPHTLQCCNPPPAGGRCKR